MAVEEWRPVAGFEDLYEVSSLGRVRSHDRIDPRGAFRTGRMLSLKMRGRRYLGVCLYRDGVSTEAYVHHLVAEAFHGPRPESKHVLHWDDDPMNNRVENLRYGTTSENRLDAVRNGVHHQTKKTHCKRGHLLVQPNLAKSMAARGFRSCLSCSRADGYARVRGLRLSRGIAMKRYIEIMTGVAA